MVAKTKRRVNVQTVLSSLQIDSMPQYLSGREEQLNRLTHEIEASMQQNGNEGHILYLYGQPGTGKTASVKQVLNKLQKSKEFALSSINALGLTSVGSLFLHLHRALFLTGKSVTIPVAFKHLDSAFRQQGFKKQPHRIVVIDEFDNLISLGKSKRNLTQRDFHLRLFSLFDWPSLPNANITLICIANTLCLPQHILPRCFSRLGLGQINFPTYNHEQLLGILQARFKSVAADSSAFFERRAEELLCRKVAAYSGDVRKLFDLCSSLLSKIEEDPKLIIDYHQVSHKCQIQFASRISDFIQLASMPVQLTSLCVCGLMPRTNDHYMGYSVGLLELRETFAAKFTQLHERIRFPFHVLDDFLANALDELQFAGIVDYVQLLRLENQRCSTKNFQPWGQLGICLIPPWGEIIAGAKNSKTTKIREYAEIVEKLCETSTK
eukprot:Gregarina_sp_Poly_1__1905@NODE_149_length_12634_cov_195_682741_g133_i0_p5_GENE_NODE_149_length_12634_cov_195_682741_g133_i0NODE_149_length_12634_cov_195_682741_g133_i0_p5_ORF_typecomplete_len437_score43_36AAA_22/PF13401_6/2_4e13AAA/PF00004_29/4_6e09ATPase_2/PF01637_18/1_8e08ATPase_2/PF01637_18/1_1e03AAA_16/PF13191_6/2_7e08AAA_lid_10/PF17872_1/1_3e07TniB/PF05621_11/4_1e07DUF815/PF05673_13/1_8e05AAA_PrkA/PF08298_11/1_2e05AAA_30/PF13604_6/2_4e05Rad17/PF03215_15/8_6e05AAA_14/PF13173_6/0_00027DUF2075